MGRYIQLPFPEGWYFGVVTTRRKEDDVGGDPVYGVTYEDGEEHFHNKGIIKDHLASPSDARRKRKPSRADLGRADPANRARADANAADVEQPRQCPRDAGGIGPLSPTALDNYLIRELRETEDGRIRPLRLEAPGLRSDLNEEDKIFLGVADEEQIPITYMTDNPKRGKSFIRYGVYSVAKTLKESILLSVTHRARGVSRDEAEALARRDILWDYSHGLIYFPGNESCLDGHYVGARAMAQEHKLLCRSDLLMSLDPNDSDQVMTMSTKVTLQNMLMNDRLANDALKLGENPVVLNALMELEMKKTKSYHAEPTTDKEADTGPDKERWRASKLKELAAMNEFNVFELVTELPSTDKKGNRIKPMTAKFVYKLKTGDDGNITSFKSRLVARGFLSREGIDHEVSEVYAPTMQYNTFRTILSAAAGAGWTLCQVDISNATFKGS